MKLLMKPVCWAAAAVMLLASCSKALSQKQKREASAHADNLCLLAEIDHLSPGEPGVVQDYMRFGFLGTLLEAHPTSQGVLSEGIRLARKRGCIK
jgi:hypothetical protein